MLINYKQYQQNDNSFYINLLQMSNVEQEAHSFNHIMDDTYDLESSFHINNENENSFTIKLCDTSFFQQRTELQTDQNRISTCTDLDLDKKENGYTSTFLIKEGEVTLIYIPKNNTQSSTKQNSPFIKNQSTLVLPKIQNPQFSSPLCLKVKRKIKPRQCSSSSTDVCADYTKNLAGYIFKKTIRLLLSKNPKTRQKLIKTCQNWGVNFFNFREYFLKLQPSISGPQSLIPFFYNSLADQTDMKRMKMFEYLICKILRGRYLLMALKEGKMKNMSAYLEIKNKYLLYFRCLFSC